MSKQTPLEVTCTCGRKLRIGAEHAGQQGKCPACGQVLEIPITNNSPVSWDLASERTETRLRRVGAILSQPGLVPGGLTEDEWLSCSDPVQMLEQLEKVASDRKLRLFACACCRSVCDSLTQRGEKLIEVAERYADGLASPGEIVEAQTTASWDSRDGVVWEAAGWLASRSAKGASVAAAQLLAESARLSAWEERSGQERAQMGSEVIAAIAAERATRVREEEDRKQCALLYDIFGNPFRTISIDPDWLLWNDGTVRKVAQGIYDDRAFPRMPLLADSLEKAGCNNRDILNHCRKSVGHVLGCWVLDLLLGKI
jgi:hypothetical protein